MIEKRIEVFRQKKLVYWEQSDTRLFLFSLLEQVGFLESALGEEYCSNSDKKSVFNWGLENVIDSNW